MEIHFYESNKVYPSNKNILHDWETTKNSIQNKVSEIHTTQMCMLSSTLFHDGYRIFVHQGDGFVYEITLKTEDNTGDRTIRWAQNMYAMWAGNVFREEK